MIYVFDSDSLINLFKHYYLDRFPSLWENFDKLVSVNEILSVREVYNEITGSRDDRLAQWAKANSDMFMQPSVEELDFVKEIFKVSQFQILINRRARLEGKPVADPFLIAKARIEKSCLVTQETHTENAAKIPTVCKHFGIQCTNLEGFMKKEGWKF